MTIAFPCPGCKKTLKAKPELAGRKLACPGCKTVLTVPHKTNSPLASVNTGLGNEVVQSDRHFDADFPILRNTEFEDIADLKNDSSAAPFDEDEFRVQPLSNPSENAVTSVSKARRLSSEDRRYLRQKKESLAWTKQAHWAFSVAFIPLIIDLLFYFSDDSTAVALLDSETIGHWFFAAISATCFLGLLTAMAWDGATKWWQLSLVAMFTSTFGILLLIVFQWLAFSTGGLLLGGGLLGIFGALLRLIGLAYVAALNPDTGFLASAVGFTFSVGLCEEICKAIPILWYFQHNPKLFWRGSMIWGMASGVGFGVAEGVMYSSDYYNGVAPADVYLIRFVSCVALHAVLSGSVAISIYRNYGDIQGQDTWYESFFILLQLIAIPMVLHGFYDTFLKKEMPIAALFTAILSFAYLAWQIQLSEKLDD